MPDNETPVGATPPTVRTTETTIITSQQPGAAAAESVAASSDADSRYEPSRMEIIGGIASLIAWTLVFAIGVIFSSDPFRDALNGKGGTVSNWLVLPYVALFLLTYTVSNVAILCCITAWLGELGRRTRIDGGTAGVDYHRGDYIAAVMRGFLAYLAILTGFVVIGSGVNVFVSPSPEGYVRLAAVVSLAGFLIGFNPALFRRFEDKLSASFATEKGKDGEEKTIAQAPPGSVIERTVTTEPVSSPETQSADTPPASASVNGSAPASRITTNAP